MDMTIGILTWNSQKLLRNCLDSLAADGMEGVDAEVVVVDNASADDTLKVLEREYSWVRTIANPVNRGVAPARNQIGEAARGEYLVFLDVDTYVKAGAMKALVEVMRTRPDVAVAGPKLVYGDGSLQLSCRPFPSLLNIVIEGTFLREYFPNSRWVLDYTMERWDHNEEREVDWMYGACLIMPTELFRRLSGFDEDFFYLYEDVDLCLRAKRSGMRVLYTPQAEVVHYLERERRSVVHRSIGVHIRSILRYLYKKWTLPARLSA